jgi:hypothetical protein
MCIVVVSDRRPGAFGMRVDVCGLFVFPSSPPFSRHMIYNMELKFYHQVWIC